MQSKRSAVVASSAALLAAVLFAPRAHAQQPHEAEQLFDEGKRLLQDGKVAEACDKLARSERLDHSLGTLGLVAACHEQQGKLALALGEYREAARIAHATGDSREQVAQQHAEDLEKKVGHLVVQPARASTVLEVRIDGARVAPDALSYIPVDPGRPLVVTVRGGAGHEIRRDLTVPAGERVAIDVRDLEVAEASPPQAPAKRAPEPEAERHKKTDGRVVGGIVAGGLGLVGLGVATAFAVAAASDNSASQVIGSIPARRRRRAPPASRCATTRSGRPRSRRSASGSAPRASRPRRCCSCGRGRARATRPRAPARRADPSRSTSPRSVAADGGGAMVRGSF